jgi:hypothetical protein
MYDQPAMEDHPVGGRGCMYIGSSAVSAFSVSPVLCFHSKEDQPADLAFSLHLMPQNTTNCWTSLVLSSDAGSHLSKVEACVGSYQEDVLNEFGKPPSGFSGGWAFFLLSMDG